MGGVTNSVGLEQYSNSVSPMAIASASASSGEQQQLDAKPYDPTVSSGSRERHCPPPDCPQTTRQGLSHLLDRRLPPVWPAAQYSPFLSRNPWSSLVRPNIDLQSERSYLLDNLHQHDQRAVRLFVKHVVLEDRLSKAPAARERRKIRKELDFVKVKIGESASQELMMLGRLSELYVEMQQRERWSQAQQLGRPCRDFQTTAGSVTSSEESSAGSPGTLNQRTPSLLSPLSPTFVPRVQSSKGTHRTTTGVARSSSVPEAEEGTGKRIDRLPDSPEQEADSFAGSQELLHRSEQLCSMLEEAQTENSIPGADPPAAVETFGLCNWGYDLCGSEVDDKDHLNGSIRAVCGHMSHPTPPKHKRMSLPCLKMTWPQMPLEYKRKSLDMAFSARCTL